MTVKMTDFGFLSLGAISKTKPCNVVDIVIPMHYVEFILGGAYIKGELRFGRW
jgi:hypothetical protein